MLKVENSTGHLLEILLTIHSGVSAASGVSRYDRNNMPDGCLDKNSGATFDGHNNFQGWVLDDNDD